LTHSTVERSLPTVKTPHTTTEASTPTQRVERAVFTVGEASTYLALKEDTIRAMLRRKELVGWRTLGANRGDWRVSRAACDEWIERQTRNA
jgi:excisionase family DNA binding protein